MRKYLLDVEAPADVIEAMSEEPLDVDVAKHIAWLETGKD